MIARNPKNGLMLNQQKRVIIFEKNRKQRNLTENWTLFNANVRGITSKRLGLMEILGEVKPQIALFTETMLKNGSGFNMDNYTFFGKGREKKLCGGVGILINNEIKHLITPS